MNRLNLTAKNEKLWLDYQEKKSENRMLFPTEGATALGVSELELLLSSPYSQYIGTNCIDVLKRLEAFGEVESIVRNELAVHEKQGLYHNLKLGEKMGLALNVGGLDLRFFVQKWAHMLAIKDDSKVDVDTPASYSIQFFDQRGNAINKVFLRDVTEENIALWQEIVETQTATVLEDTLALEAPNEKTEWQYKALDEESLASLQQQWNEMVDVHQFQFVLRKLGIDRASSYQQAPEGMTVALSNKAIESLFQAAKEKQVPVMTFVGNTGVVQIQTGLIHNVKRMGEWINILDKKEEKFTLHLNDSALEQVWIVRRPTKDGIVTCVEGFDKHGTSIVSFFGQRQEGEPEREDWKAIVSMLEAEYA